MAGRSRRTPGWLARAAMGAAALVFGLLLTAAPAQATLLPQGFFDVPVKIDKGPVGVEADRMNYDARHNTVAAEGGASFTYGGYTIRADRIEYDQATGSVIATGNVQIRDPGGDLYRMDRIEIQGTLKQAFVQTLSVTTADGALVTADDARYGEALQTILTNATYSPCGLCEDSQGRKIGWRVKAARIIYDRRSASVTLEQPSLELLGMPVAWLPWFWIPDPTQPRATGLRMPGIGGDGNRGVTLTVPYFVPAGDNVDIILSPTLMSRQGFLMQGDVAWRLPAMGEIDVRASGVYQLDPGAYSGTVGDRAWRGAIQTSGHFTPLADWTAGWSYTAFSDNQYLYDYGYSAAGLLTNEVFATRLTDDSWFDARLLSFHRLGNYDHMEDDKQALVLPQVSYDQVLDLAPGMGRVYVNGELLDVYRAADGTETFNGINYVNGNQGSKEHLMLEGGWEDQIILPGGIAATPYLATRLDAANYTRGAPPIAGGYTTTPDAMLLSATPIAALDVRWPLMARNGADTHLFEPIGQLVYRGSDTTEVGITNDDAQSFVFDDTNIFSYNRFSGIDRQETGLRANLGGHYVGNFADGSWVDLIAGQSFQLAGLNALGVSDTAMTGTNTGLGSTASYIVAGGRGGFSNGLAFGGKVQVDPASPRVTRAGAGFDYTPGPHLFSAGADYIYVAADPALGTVTDQHEIAGRVGVPITEYWTLNSGLAYDLAAMNWASVSAGATYDDGYLVYGAGATATPTSWGVGVTFKLKGPDHKPAF